MCMVYDEARSAVDVRSCRLVVLHAGPWSCDRAVIGWDGTRGKSSLEGRNVTWFDKRNTRRHAISPQSKQTSLSFSSTTACYQRQHHTPTRLPTDAVRRRSSHAITTHYMRTFSISLREESTISHHHEAWSSMNSPMAAMTITIHSIKR